MRGGWGGGRFVGPVLLRVVSGELLERTEKPGGWGTVPNAAPSPPPSS